MGQNLNPKFNAKGSKGVPRIGRPSRPFRHHGGSNRCVKPYDHYISAQDDIDLQLEEEELNQKGIHGDSRH